MSARRLAASRPRPGGVIGWVSAVSALGGRNPVRTVASLRAEDLGDWVMTGSWGVRSLPESAAWRVSVQGSIGRHHPSGRRTRGRSDLSHAARRLQQQAVGGPGLATLIGEVAVGGLGGGGEELLQAAGVAVLPPAAGGEQAVGRPVPPARGERPR